MTDIIFKVSRPTTVLITDLLEEDINAIEAFKLPEILELYRNTESTQGGSDNE